MTKTALHQLDGFAAQYGGSRHRVPQTVEGHRGQGSPLQGSAVVGVDIVHSPLVKQA